MLKLSLFFIWGWLFKRIYLKTPSVRISHPVLEVYYRTTRVFDINMSPPVYVQKSEKMQAFDYENVVSQCFGSKLELEKIFGFFRL